MIQWPEHFLEFMLDFVAMKSLSLLPYMWNICHIFDVQLKWIKLVLFEELMENMIRRTQDFLRENLGSQDLAKVLKAEIVQVRNFSKAENINDIEIEQEKMLHVF